MVARGPKGQKLPHITHHTSHITHHTPYITHRTPHTTHRTPRITHLVPRPHRAFVPDLFRRLWVAECDVEEHPQRAPVGRARMQGPRVEDCHVALGWWLGSKYSTLTQILVVDTRRGVESGRQKEAEEVKGRGRRSKEVEGSGRRSKEVEGGQRTWKEVKGRGKTWKEVEGGRRRSKEVQPRTHLS